MALLCVSAFFSMLLHLLLYQVLWFALYTPEWKHTGVDTVTVIDCNNNTWAVALQFVFVPSQ